MPATFASVHFYMLLLPLVNDEKLTAESLRWLHCEKSALAEVAWKGQEEAKARLREPRESSGYETGEA